MIALPLDLPSPCCQASSQVRVAGVPLPLLVVLGIEDLVV